MPDDNPPRHDSLFRTSLFRISLFSAVHPRERPWAQLLAGLTLAAISVPQVLGFARIAGMPIETGLFTMIAPAIAYVAFCSSRHLVVGADSATAAIVAAGVGGLAVSGSHQYVRLVGMVALLTGVLLLIARLLRLGFLADFMSRTLLVGFLAGVGVQVACTQLPQVLGVPVHADGAVRTLVDVVRHLGSSTPVDVVLSTTTILVILVGDRFARRVPWGLFVVVGSIALVGLGGLDVSTIADVPSGLPLPVLPGAGLDQIHRLMPTVLMLTVVVLAQSAATSRAYAARHDEVVDVDADLAGLAGANLVAGLSGTFVVNGSPTRTEVAESAGATTQLAQLASAGAALLVLTLLAPTLTYLPTSVLASIVTVIAVRLVDVHALRRTFERRRVEGAVALATTATVILAGVGPGILFAVALSIAAHLRHSYRPNARLVARAGGNGGSGGGSGAGEQVGTAGDRWRLSRLESARQVEPGLVIYFVSANLYFANSSHVVNEVMGLVDDADPPLRWLCLFAIGIDDVDLTASDALRWLLGELSAKGVQLVMVGVEPHVRHELDRDGFMAQLGDEHVFDYLEDAISAYRSL